MLDIRVTEGGGGGGVEKSPLVLHQSKKPGMNRVKTAASCWINLRYSIETSQNVVTFIVVWKKLY